ncbi:MAG TPA: hypothetical protein VMK83_09165 [Gaiellaceae bacterium]|nr:hypothetical protein [Gaiellaceae bacterium]
MTRTISIITATVGAALLFAVPAWGDNWGADQRSDSLGYVNPDSADRAAALEQQKATAAIDAREAAQTAKYEARLASTPYPDVFERAANAAIRDGRGVVVVDDRFDLHPQSVPTSVTATGSGREIDFPQVGIGLGIGLLLALGLYLALRFTHSRPVTH